MIIYIPPPKPWREHVRTFIGRMALTMIELPIAVAILVLLDRYGVIPRYPPLTPGSGP